MGANARRSQKLQERIRPGGTGSSSEDSDAVRVGRIPRQKVGGQARGRASVVPTAHLLFVSWEGEETQVRVHRNQLLASAAKVLESFGASRTILEIEYFDEVGVGLVRAEREEAGAGHVAAGWRVPHPPFLLTCSLAHLLTCSLGSRFVR